MPFPYRVILVSLLLHSFNCCTHSPIRHFAFVTLRSFPMFCHISFLFSFNAVPIILCHLMSNLVDSLDLLLSFSTQMIHSVVLKVSLYLFPFQGSPGPIPIPFPFPPFFLPLSDDSRFRSSGSMYIPFPSRAVQCVCNNQHMQMSDSGLADAEGR